MFTFYSSQWIEDGYLLGQCDSNTLRITLIVYIQQWSPVVTVMDVTVRIMMMMVIIVTLIAAFSYDCCIVSIYRDLLN